MLLSLLFILHVAAGALEESATKPAPKVTPLAESDDKNDKNDKDGFNESDWGVRVWGGKRWIPKELRLVEGKQVGKVFVATHASLVDKDVVFLSNEKQFIPAEVDFQIIVRVSGNGDVGLLRREGQLRGTVAFKLIRPDPVTLTIRRESGKISFLLNNTPANAATGNEARDNDAYVFAIALNRKESVRIHEFHISVSPGK